MRIARCASAGRHPGVVSQREARNGGHLLQRFRSGRSIVYNVVVGHTSITSAVPGPRISRVIPPVIRHRSSRISLHRTPTIADVPRALFRYGIPREARDLVDDSFPLLSPSVYVEKALRARVVARGRVGSAAADYVRPRRADRETGGRVPTVVDLGSARGRRRLIECTCRWRGWGRCRGERRAAGSVGILRRRRATTKVHSGAKVQREHDDDGGRPRERSEINLRAVLCRQRGVPLTRRKCRQVEIICAVRCAGGTHCPQITWCGPRLTETSNSGGDRWDGRAAILPQFNRTTHSLARSGLLTALSEKKKFPNGRSSTFENSRPARAEFATKGARSGDYAEEERRRALLLIASRRRRSHCGRGRL